MALIRNAGEASTLGGDGRERRAGTVRHSPVERRLLRWDTNRRLPPTVRILVVEDEPKVAGFIAEGLRELGYAVDLAPDGEEGLWRASNTAYDVILLDLLMPRMGGVAMLEQLRKAGNGTRVLMLTARDSVRDRVAGLNHGADDYLPKPFDFDELVARIGALLRRPAQATPAVLRCGDLELDPRTHRVQRAGKPVELSVKQFAILEYLLRHPDEIVSRSKLAEHVWDENYDAASNVIDVTLHHLRIRIDRGHPTALIQTVRGAGYVLRTPEGGGR